MPPRGPQDRRVRGLRKDPLGTRAAECWPNTPLFGLEIGHNVAMELSGTIGETLALRIIDQVHDGERDLAKLREDAIAHLAQSKFVNERPSQSSASGTDADRMGL